MRIFKAGIEGFWDCKIVVPLRGAKKLIDNQLKQPPTKARKNEGNQLDNQCLHY